MPFASLAPVAFLVGSVLSVSVPEAGRVFAPSAPPEIRIEVSIADRQLSVVREGEVIRSYAVAVGQAEFPTPTGSFSIGRVIWNPRWVPPEAEWAEDEKVREPGDPENPMGKVKLFFQEPDYYIHGTDVEESLGRAASHGCIRMSNPDVVELARLVMEHGGENRSPNWFQRIINFVRSTEEVRLSNPVPISVRA